MCVVVHSMVSRNNLPKKMIEENCLLVKAHITNSKAKKLLYIVSRATL